MQDVLNEKICLISVAVSAFTGYRRATRDVIIQLGGNLPDCEAVTEGSIKVFPNEGVTGLQSVRRGLFRKLASKSIRALGSQNVFAILCEDLAEAEKEIAEAEVEFNAKRDELEQNYDSLFEDHVAKNPLAETIIRSLKIPMNVAVARCQFSTSTFRITPMVRDGEDEVSGVESIVRGLGRQLYDEVSAEMQKLLANTVFSKNRRVGQRSLRPIKAAADKMGKFTFIDPSVSGAIQLIGDTLATLPQEGYIEGNDFTVLERLVEVLADTDDLVNAASKVHNGIAAIDAIFPPVVPQQADVEAEHPEAKTEAATEGEAVVAGQVQADLPPMPGADATPEQKAAFNVETDKVMNAQLVKLVSVPTKAPSALPPLPPMPGVLKPPGLVKPNSLLF